MVPFNVAGLAAAKGGNAAMNALPRHDAAQLHRRQRLRLGRQRAQHRAAWEYDYTGEPYKTQSTVRAIQDQIWADAPNGLADGNDDLGAMSAWYVWSALGMYPQTPGTADLALGSPMFSQAVLTLPMAAP